MKKSISATLIILYILSAVLSGCADNRKSLNIESQSLGSDIAETGAGVEKTEALPLIENEVAGQYDKEEEVMNRKMIVEIGGQFFTATLENNKAADTMVEIMRKNPITIQMKDYSGFEKVGDLGTDLPTSNRQTTTRTGDIVLYQGNQIVIFYGSNSWSYTRLGKIDDLTGWKNALGNGDVTVTFALEE